MSASNPHDLTPPPPSRTLVAIFANPIPSNQFSPFECPASTEIQNPQPITALKILGGAFNTVGKKRHQLERNAPSDPAERGRGRGKHIGSSFWRGKCKAEQSRASPLPDITYSGFCAGFEKAEGARGWRRTCGKSRQGIIGLAGRRGHEFRCQFAVLRSRFQFSVLSSQSFDPRSCL